MVSAAPVTLALVLALFGAAHALHVDAPCEQRQAVQDFDMEAFRGTWYEIYRYNNELQLEAECATAEMYAPEDDATNLRMYSSMVFFDPEFRLKEKTMTGTFAYPDAASPVGSFNLVAEGSYDYTNYNVLATDYENYALAWSCADNEDGSSDQMAWVFSRSRYTREEVQDEVDALIDEHFDRASLRETFFDDHYCLGGEIEPAL